MVERRNTIRTFALICVAATSLFLMGVITWLIWLLKSDWCFKALGAAQVANRPTEAVQACFEMMRLQILALSVNSYMGMGSLALCLLVLMVVVVAGGRLSFSASRDGVSGNIAGKDDDPLPPSPADAARLIADKVDEAASQIESATPPVTDKEVE